MGFDFNLNIVTGGSGPAVGLVAANLEKTDKGAKHAAEGVKLFETEAGKAAVTFGGLSLSLRALDNGKGSLFTFDLAEGLRSAYEIGEKLVEKVIDLGKEIVRSVAGTEDLGVALKFSVGPEKAEEVEKLADAFQSVTRYKSDAFKQAWLPLLNAGLKDTAMIGVLTSAAGDIAVQMNTGEAGMKENLATLGRIALGGKIKESALKQFNIHPQEFYADIAKSIHVTQDEAAKMLKAGRIGSEQILDTVLTEVSHKGGDKGVGAAMLASADTMGGLLDRIKKVPDEIFVKLAGSDGMEKLKSTLGNVITALEEKAPAAVAYLNEWFGRLFGDVSGPDGLDKIRSTLDELWPAVKKGADDALVVIKGIAGAVVTIANAINSVQSASDKYDKLKAKGGITGAVAHVPFLRGALADPDAAPPMADPRMPWLLPGEQAFVRRQSGSQAQASSVNVHAPVVIHVDGSGSPKETAEEIARHLRQRDVELGQQLSSHS